MAVHVRQARHADLSAVQSVVSDSWRAAYADLLPEDALAFIADESRFLPEDALATVVESDDVLFLVALVDGRLVGELQFAYGPETHTFVSPAEGEVELQSLYVDPDYWRRGVGSALVDAGFDHLRDDDDAALVEVLTANEAARRFYREQGFEPYGERTIELFGLLYGSTIMRRDLR